MKKNRYFWTLVGAFVLYLLVEKEVNSSFTVYDSKEIPHTISKDSADAAILKETKRHK